MPTPPRQLTVWVTEDAVAAMEAEARRAHPLETGGMLLGWENEVTFVVAVTHVIGPGPKARHRRSSFEPDADWQQAQLNRVYSESERIVTYLGDWHVHPDGGFGMSYRDRKTLRSIATEEAARCPRPIMALLAGDSEGGYQFGVWAWASNWKPWSPGDAIAVAHERWRDCDESALRG